MANGRGSLCHAGKFPMDSTLLDDVDSPTRTRGEGKEGGMPASDSGRVLSAREG